MNGKRADWIPVSTFFDGGKRKKTMIATRKMFLYSNIKSLRISKEEKLCLYVIPIYCHPCRWEVFF